MEELIPPAQIQDNILLSTVEEEPSSLEVNPIKAEDEVEEMPPVECDFCQCRRAEISRLLEESRTLKRELDQRKMDEHFLKDDNVKVKCYTGLTDFEAMLGVLAWVGPHLKQSSKMPSPFQMLFLTLIRLRLNLPTFFMSTEELFPKPLVTSSISFIHTSALTVQGKMDCIW